MKLFSGDDKGRVVFSAVDLDQVTSQDIRNQQQQGSCVLTVLCVQGVCKPVVLLEESSSVVQLEYSQQVLLVSTQHRSLLYCTQTQEVQQLGIKARRR